MAITPEDIKRQYEAFKQHRYPNDTEYDLVNCMVRWAEARTKLSKKEYMNNRDDGRALVLGFVLFVVTLILGFSKYGGADISWGVVVLPVLFLPIFTLMVMGIYLLGYTIMVCIKLLKGVIAEIRDKVNGRIG